VAEPPWDPEKARRNFAKHSVTFDEARFAVNHPLSREWPDVTHSDSEARSIFIGPSPTGQILFVVVAANADGMIRYISARRATKRERHAYEDL
jgi:uncharacterized DUF497 family protein